MTRTADGRVAYRMGEIGDVGAILQCIFTLSPRPMFRRFSWEVGACVAVEVYNGALTTADELCQLLSRAGITVNDDICNEARIVSSATLLSFLGSAYGMMVIKGETVHEQLMQSVGHYHEAMTGISTIEFLDLGEAAISRSAVSFASPEVKLNHGQLASRSLAANLAERLQRSGIAWNVTLSTEASSILEAATMRLLSAIDRINKMPRSRRLLLFREIDRRATEAV